MDMTVKNSINFQKILVLLSPFTKMVFWEPFSKSQKVDVLEFQMREFQLLKS